MPETNPLSVFTHPEIESRMSLNGLKGLTGLTGRTLRRHAARGIVLRDDQLLLLFTERYNDFSLPGGGVDSGEDLEVALKRELFEETGAQDVTVKRYYGYVEEYRPYWKPTHDLMHMTSHFYVCDAAVDLSKARMEDYEIANGMRPMWVPVIKALEHNRQVLARTEESMGQSIVRETFMLDKIARELIG